jgi:hypothetical protein
VGAPIAYAVNEIVRTKANRPIRRYDVIGDDIQRMIERGSAARSTDHPGSGRTDPPEQP